MFTGERIKELRMHAGIKQSELAEAIGCTSQVISNVERGYTSLSLELLLNLADFFHVSADYVLGKTDQKINTLSMDEEVLIGYFRSSSDNEKRILMGLIKDLIMKEKK